MKPEPEFSVSKAFLQRQALFGGFNDADLDVVMPLMARETFAAGVCIVREGETGDRLYFIESGRVEVFKQTGEGERRISEMGAGEEFGEMELIDIHPRSATVRAVEPVETLSLRNRDLLRLYHEHVEIFSRLLLNLAREISRRFRRAEERML